MARAPPRAVLRRGRTCLVPLARGLCSARLLGNLGSGPCVKVLLHPCRFMFYLNTVFKKIPEEGKKSVPLTGDAVAQRFGLFVS